jgi:hypothetical protein
MDMRGSILGAFLDLMAWKGVLVVNARDVLVALRIEVWVVEVVLRDCEVSVVLRKDWRRGVRRRASVVWDWDAIV